jgi:purine-binding chemotaxis protein CheW
MTKCEFLTIVVEGQEFGVPVMDIHDVLRAQAMTRVPKAGSGIAGMLNLRGRIVTALDMRSCLELQSRADGGDSIHIVVHFNGEPYGLVVDSVRDVITLADEDREAPPKNFDPHWASLITGVHRLEGKLLLVLNIERVIEAARARRPQAA